MRSRGAAPAAAWEREALSVVSSSGLENSWNHKKDSLESNLMVRFLHLRADALQRDSKKSRIGNT